MHSLHSLAHSSFLHLQRQQCITFRDLSPPVSIVTLPSVSNLLPPSYKDPCAYIGPTWIIQDIASSQNP